MFPLQQWNLLPGARHEKKIRSAAPPLGYNDDEKAARKKQELRFACADALEDDSWSEATMIFTHSTAFDSEMMVEV